MSAAIPLDPTIVLIGAGEACRWFDRIGGYVQNMAESSNGRFHREDIEEAIARGAMQLWCVFVGPDVAAVVVTEVVSYPRSQACRLIGCVGRGMRKWIHLHEFVRAWARAQGCDRMEAFARFGWARVMERYGYEPFHVMLEAVA